MPKSPSNSTAPSPASTTTLTPLDMAQQLARSSTSVVACAHACVHRAGLRSGDLDAIYLTGGSSALRPFQQALRHGFVGVPLVEGDLFGGVAAGLAYAARSKACRPRRSMHEIPGRLSARAARAGPAADASRRAASPACCASATPPRTRSAPTARCTTTSTASSPTSCATPSRCRKVAFDSKLHVIRNALGTHTTVQRVQGSKLKTKREIRVASLFKEVPDEWLRMIVVHELAHMKQRDHDKAFYALCTHMEPAYHQLEFDLRLYLTHLDAWRRAALVVRRFAHARSRPLQWPLHPAHRGCDDTVPLAGPGPARVRLRLQSAPRMPGPDPARRRRWRWTSAAAPAPSARRCASASRIARCGAASSILRPRNWRASISTMWSNRTSRRSTSTRWAWASPSTWSASSTCSNTWSTLATAARPAAHRRARRAGAREPAERIEPADALRRLARPLALPPLGPAGLHAPALLHRLRRAQDVLPGRLPRAGPSRHLPWRRRRDLPAPPRRELPADA